MRGHSLEYKLVVGFVSSLIAGIVILIWEYHLRGQHVRTASAIHYLVYRAKTDTQCRDAYIDSLLKIATRDQIMKLTGEDVSKL